jgi:very-short-patch-repair endonuclease
MRHAPTRSEERLWGLLRAGALGVVFRRQYRIGRYIADFVATSARLVVEVDGGSHSGRERLDARRDRALERAGYRVLRLPAEVVLGNPSVAVERVRGALGPGRG